MGDFGFVPHARRELERFDAELARLGRGAAALRLRMGEALEALRRRGGHHELGFSSIDAYALERCERPARWSSDARALARRLEQLPVLRHALVSGELGWSMAELLSRHATPDNEAALLERARGATVRAMRRALSHDEHQTSSDADDETRRELSVTVPRVDAWALEYTRLLLAAAQETRGSDDLVEALLAEGFTTLQTVAPRAANADLDSLDEAFARAAQWKAQLAAWRGEAEEACEPFVDRTVGPSVPRDFPEPLDGLGPAELDREARRLARELASRDLVIGAIFERLRGADGWRRLGWATEAQYARERVGVSHASLKSRRTLSRRAELLPVIAAALESGRIGYEAAMLVARVANPDTVQAWLARAQERTLKHLRQELDAVEMAARVEGDARLLVPPDDEVMAAYFALESHVLSGRAALGEPPAGDGQKSGGPDSPDPNAARDRVRGGAADVTLRFRVSDELYLFWRDLERRFATSNIPGSFLGFLCIATWQTWSQTFDAEAAYAEIYLRDGYRCASPVCPARHVTPHHLRFRSQGGGDESENVSSLCLWCHLRGLHQGRLRAEPPASRITWTIGREPIMVVAHRRRILLDDAPGNS